MKEKLNVEDKFLSEVEVLLDKTLKELNLEEMEIIYENYVEGLSPECAAKKVREYNTAIGSRYNHGT